jgi:hypothetical protein
VNRAPIRHLGGHIMTDHGPLSLAAARGLAAFYRQESKACRAAGAVAWETSCENRAEDLERAVAEAALWRRAAGWGDPDAADAAPLVHRAGDLRAPAPP